MTATTRRLRGDRRADNRQGRGLEPKNPQAGALGLQRGFATRAR